MNLEQVSHFIAHPQELGTNEAPALKELSEKYLYASIFSLLYLTALANGKSTDLDTALKSHAYKLSDRTKLYHLVHSTSSNDQPAEELKTETDREPEAVPLHRMVEESATALEPEPEIILPETMASEPHIVLPEDETPVEPEAASLEATEAAAVDFDLVTEAFTREQHFELEEQAPPVTSREEGQREVTKPVKPGEEQKPATESAPFAPPSEPASLRSFTSWLKSSSAAPREPAETTAPQPVEPEKAKVGDLIDNFLKEEPTITRGKTEFFSPSKKAKESLDEEAVPVSETLAKIYAAQGNYPKAIHVYHQLMLSFPEKKSLFAVQIEALKKKITP